MSERVLISFLGKGRQQDFNGTRSGYEQVKYEFPAQDDGPGAQHTTTLFGWALWQRLAATGRRPHRWLILGTPESIWTALGDVFGDAEQGVACLEALKSNGNGVTSDQLAAAAALIQPLLCEGRPKHETCVDLRLTTACRTKAQQQELFALLDSALHEHDNVTLDITHGFRHLPVLLSFMLNLLAFTKDVRVKGMFYGAREMTENGHTPVVDLAACVDYSALTAGAATLANTGNYRRLAEHYPNEIRKKLEQMAFLESSNRVARGRQVARECRNFLDRYAEDDVPATINKKIRDALAWSDGDNYAARVVERGKFCLDHRDYAKAAALLFEGIILHAARRAGIQLTDTYDETRRLEAEKWLEGMNFRELRVLRHVRNALAHGTEPTDAAAQSVLATEDHLHRFLQRISDLADQVAQP